MSIKDELKDFYEEYASKPRYYALVLMSLIISYGYSMFSRTISVDDLSQYLYYGSGNTKLASFRWGATLCNRLFGTVSFTPYISEFFGVFFYFASSFLFSFIIYNVSEKKLKPIHYGIISSIFVSYPLTTARWECYEGLTISFCFVLIFISIIYLLFSDYKIKDFLICGFILSIVMSGYESVGFAYITFVLIILFIKNCLNKSNELYWIEEGFYYAIPLIISVILRYVIGIVLIIIFGLEITRNGATSILWLSDGIGNCIKQILYNGWYYVVRGLSFFPITEFVISVIIFILVSIKLIIEKKKKVFVIGMCILLSLFFLSFVRGDYLFYGMAQTIQVFIPFVAYLMLQISINNRILRIVVAIFLVLVVDRQSIYTHELCALNNLRSDNESNVMRQIGYRIYSEFDKEKTVIFCGEYQLSDYIGKQMYIDENSFAGKTELFVRKLIGKEERKYRTSYVDAAVMPIINWNITAEEGYEMKLYLSYFGYDINVLKEIPGNEREYLYKYELIAKKENMKPLDIKDMGDYLLVYFGPTMDNIYD